MNVRVSTSYLDDLKGNSWGSRIQDRFLSHLKEYIIKNEPRQKQNMSVLVRRGSRNFRQGGGVHPSEKFCVKSCTFRQNNHGNGTFMEARDSEYDERTLFELGSDSDFFNIYTMYTQLVILAIRASQKK